MDQVVLVNTSDEVIGQMEKMEAHRQGALHRAFSVFIFNEDHQMLLQRRAKSKYHSGGLWTNACCSHPLPGEDTLFACHRRLREEMGFETDLKFVTSFIYSAALDSGLTEHEFDHVFVGQYSSDPLPDPNEVEEWKFESLDKLEQDILDNPGHYTVWFRLIFSTVKDYFLAGKIA